MRNNITKKYNKRNKKRGGDSFQDRRNRVNIEYENCVYKARDNKEVNVFIEFQ